ncbi:MAG: hypothetical protein ABI885_24300 [Gammaproteobacteria bacterium]
MAMPARKIEREPQMVEQTVLEERVAHIQSDVAELKVDVRRLDAKIDSLGARLDAKIDAMGASLDAKIVSLGERLDAKIDAMGQRLDAKIDALSQRMSDLHISHLKWTVGTMLGGMGTAFAIAKYLH